MSSSTILTLLGLALVDSLNPSTITQAAVLSAGRHPVRAVMAFWSGALSAYLVLGVLLVLGPAQLIEDVVTDPPRGLRLAGLAIGPALIVGAAIAWSRLRRRPLRDADAARPAAAWRPRTDVAFTMGLLSTAVDAFTAVPYIAAATIVTSQDISVPAQLATLLAYNLVYLSPVLAVLGLRLLLGARIEPVVDRLMATLERFGAPALALVAAGAGTFLTVVGLRAL